MSKVEAVPQPSTISPETVAVIKTLVQELNAPTAKQVEAEKQELEQRKSMALIAKAEHERKEATKLFCPHKQDQGQSHKSALVFVRGQSGLADSFIICQCCSKVVKPTDAEWNQYVTSCPR
jgi:hypothetical protein